MKEQSLIRQHKIPVFRTKKKGGALASASPYYNALIDVVLNLFFLG